MYCISFICGIIESYILFFQESRWIPDLFLIDALQLSRGDRLLQWLIFQFFHRVFDEKEKSISYTPKRRMVFRKGQILLSSAENGKIKFSLADKMRTWFQVSLIPFQKKVWRRQIPITPETMILLHREYCIKESLY